MKGNTNTSIKIQNYIDPDSKLHVLTFDITNGDMCVRLLFSADHSLSWHTTHAHFAASAHTEWSAAHLGR